MSTTSPIDEIAIDLQATVWKFDMQRGYANNFNDSTEKTWYSADSFVMALIPERGRKRRTMACFYDEDGHEWMQDLIEENGGSNAVLVLPWDVFCRSVERLGAAGTGSAIPIPGRNGTLVTDGTDAFYTTACNAYYRLSLAALEALAR